MCRGRLPTKEPKVPSPPQLPAALPDQKRAALENHRRLQQSLVALRRQLAAGAVDNHSSSKLLAECQQHSDSLAAYLSTTIEPTYYAEHIPPFSTATHRTLAIPELFELILDYLHVPAILAFYQSCKEYKSRIDNSAHVQTRLCLRPAPPSSKFRMPFKKCLLSPGEGKAGFYCKPSTALRCSVKYRDGDKPRMSITAAFRTSDPEQIVPPIGASYRRMFITQPPVTTLTPWTRCCASPPSIEQFVRQEGITLGDLHAATQELIEKHRLCPHAPHRDLMLENGENYVQVMWKGEVVLEQGDPKVAKGRRELKAREQKKRANELKSRKMGEYGRVKREGAQRSSFVVPVTCTDQH